jgi:hypothetical protein
MECPFLSFFICSARRNLTHYISIGGSTKLIMGNKEYVGSGTKNQTATERT